MANSEPSRTGGCLCGTIRYEAKGEPSDVAVCHCTRCQRWSGSAFMPGASFTEDTVTWNTEPSFFDLNEGCKRAFCPKCGSSLAFHYSGGQLWINLGTLDDVEKLKPKYHLFTENGVSWAQTNDDLPRHAQTSAGWSNN